MSILAEPNPAGEHGIGSHSERMLELANGQSPWTNSIRNLQHDYWLDSNDFDPHVSDVQLEYM